MENLTYEQALSELQQIVVELESGVITMDELSEKTTRAAALIAFCREKLRQTENQIKEIFKE